MNAKNIIHKFLIRCGVKACKHENYSWISGFGNKCDICEQYLQVNRNDAQQKRTVVSKTRIMDEPVDDDVLNIFDIIADRTVEISFEDLLSYARKVLNIEILTERGNGTHFRCEATYELINSKKHLHLGQGLSIKETDDDMDFTEWGFYLEGDCFALIFKNSRKLTIKPSISKGDSLLNSIGEYQPKLDAEFIRTTYKALVLLELEFKKYKSKGDETNDRIFDKTQLFVNNQKLKNEHEENSKKENYH